MINAVEYRLPLGNISPEILTRCQSLSLSIPINLITMYLVLFLMMIFDILTITTILKSQR